MNEKRKQQIIAIVGVIVISIIMICVIASVYGVEPIIEVIPRNAPKSMYGDMNELYERGKWYHTEFDFDKYDQRTKVIDRMSCGGIIDWYESNYASVFRPYAAYKYTEKHC